MYKYIFTHTHIDLQLVEDISAKLQQKWHQYDSDEDIKNIKTQQWHQLWSFPSREQVLLKLLYLLRLAVNTALNSSLLEWLKKTKHSYPQNSLLQTQMLLVLLPAHSLTGSGTGLWLKGAEKHGTWTWPNKECGPSLGPTALPAPGLQPQLSSCSPLMTGLYYSQLDRSYGKAVLWEALYGLEHMTPVDAQRRENCQSPSHFRNKNLPRDEAPILQLQTPSLPAQRPTTSPRGNQPKTAANPPAVCTKEEQQAQWVSKASDGHTKTSVPLLALAPGQTWPPLPRGAHKVQVETLKLNGKHFVL